MRLQHTLNGAMKMSDFSILKFVLIYVLYWKVFAFNGLKNNVLPIAKKSDSFQVMEGNLLTLSLEKLSQFLLQSDNGKITFPALQNFFYFINFLCDLKNRLLQKLNSCKNCSSALLFVFPFHFFLSSDFTHAHGFKIQGDVFQ